MIIQCSHEQPYLNTSWPNKTDPDNTLSNKGQSTMLSNEYLITVFMREPNKWSSSVPVNIWQATFRTTFL